MHQDLVLGRANQRIVLDPPGRPTGEATVVVESWQGIPQAATAGACSIDPVETALVDDAPIAAMSLTLASTANIAPGTRYQLAGPDGIREWVVVMGVVGARVMTRRPLVNRFPRGAILGGCRISIAVDRAWVSNAANVTEHLDVHAGYTVRWTHSLGESTTTADVVRVPLQHRLSPRDVDARFPGWLPAAYRTSGGIELIAEAIELVQRDVARHPEIRRARDAAALRDLAIIRAKLVAVEHAIMFEHAATTTLAAAEGRYQQRFAELLAHARSHPLTPIAEPEPERAPELSIAHVPVIDQLMDWLTTHPLDTKWRVREFGEVWGPRLKTADERAVAGKLLVAAVKYKELAYFRDEVLEELGLLGKLGLRK